MTKISHRSTSEDSNGTFVDGTIAGSAPVPPDRVLFGPGRPGPPPSFGIPRTKFFAKFLSQSQCYFKSDRKGRHAACHRRSAAPRLCRGSAMAALFSLCARTEVNEGPGKHLLSWIDPGFASLHTDAEFTCRASWHRADLQALTRETTGRCMLCGEPSGVCGVDHSLALALAAVALFAVTLPGRGSAKTILRLWRARGGAPPSELQATPVQGARRR